MPVPRFDFSHLTPSERMELAEQLWDSLSSEGFELTPDQVEELRRRRAALARDGSPGLPWQDVLKEIKERGA